MNGVVIQAHPVPNSYNEALLASTLAGLELAGVDATTHKLYDGNDPGPLELSGADVLAFIYPTWWGGLPSIMLDWVQRRLGDALDSEAPSPISNVRRLLAVTSHGSSWWVNRLQGEPGRHQLLRDVTGLCASDARAAWISLYKLDRRSSDHLSNHLAKVQRRVARSSA